MSFPLVLVIAALSGFIALSYEIVWYRAYAFVSQGSPAAFGLLLGAYLEGLAFGSLVSRRYCREGDAAFQESALRPLAAFVYLANVVSLLVVPGLGAIAAHTTSWRMAFALVIPAAGLLGGTLPLIAHFGIRPDERAGERLSYVYLANILGSVAGSLLTGFVLFDHLTLGAITTSLAVVGVALSLLLYLASRPARARVGLAVAAAVASVALALLASPALHRRLYERLIWGPEQAQHPALAEIVENRHGVIAVEPNGTVWGGGAYDGRFNTSLLQDRNSVVRAYVVAALHPSPRRLLLIGLSTGSWAQVLVHMPGVEHLTAIEINPGYLDLIRHHAEVSSLLTNPKVSVVIDDGRRWLRRHPSERFDVIVMNTTWHYRAHITNLLSTEFLQIARSHLAPGGVLFYNTTSSRDAVRTGIEVFPHALRFHNFLAVSDSPFALSRDHWERSLRAWSIDGAPVIDPSQPDQATRLDRLLGLLDPAREQLPADRIEDRPSLLATHADAHVITDDNMWSEWWSPYAP